MKYNTAAIFFWPIFTGQGGGMAPLPPPLDPLLGENIFGSGFVYRKIFLSDSVLT